jgi:protease I
VKEEDNKVKRAVVLTADKFEDLEVYVPIFRLIEAGVRVDVAAPKKEEIHGENGYTLMPDMTIDEVNPDDYDLLIIPGGYPDGAPLTVSKHPKAIAITKDFLQKTNQSLLVEFMRIRRL